MNYANFRKKLVDTTIRSKIIKQNKIKYQYLGLREIYVLNKIMQGYKISNIIFPKAIEDENNSLDKIINMFIEKKLIDQNYNLLIPKEDILDILTFKMCEKKYQHQFAFRFIDNSITYGCFFDILELIS